MISEWETLARMRRQDCKIFTLDAVQRRHPIRGDESEFAVINSPAWVNIIPITRAGEVLLIRQYRHGSDSITLEIPGGLVNEGEDPAIAAQRECREETGYASGQDAILLGSHLPNPAFLNNTCYAYLWRDCMPVGAQRFDEHEEIEVLAVPMAQVDDLIKRGEIRHSLVLTAFFFYMLQNGSLQ